MRLSTIVFCTAVILVAACVEVKGNKTAKLTKDGAKAGRSRTRRDFQGIMDMVSGMMGGAGGAQGKGGAGGGNPMEMLAKMGKQLQGMFKGMGMQGGGGGGKRGGGKRGGGGGGGGAPAPAPE